MFAPYYGPILFVIGLWLRKGYRSHRAPGKREGQMPDKERFWALTEKESAAVSSAEDAKERPLAFAEKRAPQWKGR